MLTSYASTLLHSWVASLYVKKTECLACLSSVAVLLRRVEKQGLLHLGLRGLRFQTPHCTPAWVSVAPETSTTADPPSIRITDPVMNVESSLAR
jgi:hypothetical protein